MNSVMSDKNLAKLVSEAFNAPRGSTKLVKARAIFASLGKSYPKYDGRGGVSSSIFGNPVQGQVLTPTAYDSLGQGMSSMYGQPDNTEQQNTNPNTVYITAAPALRVNGQLTSTDANTAEVIPPTDNPLNPNPNALVTAINNNANHTVVQLTTPSSNLGAGTGTGTGAVNYSSQISNASIDGWWKSLSATDKKNNQSLYDALKNQVGADSFAASTIVDKEKMHALFPNVPIEDLPVGASYLGQYKQIEQGLRDDYKLDTMESNITRLQKVGVNIESDLDGYMTSRDNNIKMLDSMISKSQEASFTTSSDPSKQAQLSDYTNYLLVMKGRAQKRYADFVTQAVTQYNGELTNAENIYKTTYDAFTSSLADAKEMTKDNYNNYTAQLKSLYDNINGREQNLYNQMLLQDKIAKLQAGQIGTATSGGTDTDATGVKMTTANTNTAYSKYFQAKTKDGATLADITSSWNKMPAAEKAGWLSYSNTASTDWATSLKNSLGGTSAPSSQPKTPGTVTDNGNGTYTYVNQDSSLHTGPYGDNYKDKTKAK
jgi:hypothetical protein